MSEEGSSVASPIDNFEGLEPNQIQLGTLEVSDLPSINTGHSIISGWRLESQELEQLRTNGGVVYLCVLGSVQPPVVISTDLEGLMALRRPQS